MYAIYKFCLCSRNQYEYMNDSVEYDGVMLKIFNTQLSLSYEEIGYKNYTGLSCPHIASKVISDKIKVVNDCNKDAIYPLIKEIFANCEYKYDNDLENLGINKIKMILLEYFEVYMYSIELN